MLRYTVEKVNLSYLPMDQTGVVARNLPLSQNFQRNLVSSIANDIPRNIRKTHLCYAFASYGL